jgi:carbon-monoxide dehydrogenase medium subunit
VKPAAFAYVAPETVEEALAVLAQHGDEAKPLAGGQSLVPVLNFRLARPAVLVDLNRIRSLSGITADNSALRIGAMTRQRAVERHDDVGRKAPLLAESLGFVAHPQIRNRGTFGGSLAHADPAAEMPAIALALGARMRLRRGAQERWLGASDFFTGLFSTALAPDELLVEVEIPALPARTGTSFQEVARRHGDYALLGVGAVVTLDNNGVCQSAALAYVNGGPGPLRAQRAEAALVGERAQNNRFETIAQLALQELRPPTDVHAPSDYRLQLARELTKRVLATAFARARS